MRIRMLAAWTGLATVALIGTALPASAADQNGKCEAREACFYYNGNLGGSFSDFYYPSTDLAGKRFLSAGAGKGQAVKNNAASARNMYGHALRVYYNENYSGPYDQVAAFGWKNLVNTWNDNASFNWPS